MPSGESQQGKRKKPSSNVENVTRGVDILIARTSDPRVTQGRNHAGAMFLIRSWINIASRKRDLSLFSKALDCARQIGATLDDVFGVAQGAAPSMLGLPALIRNPAVTDVEVFGDRASEGEFSEHMFKVMGGRSEWMFGRHEKSGLVRFFVTKEFERDFGLTWEVRRDMYLGKIPSPGGKEPFVLACADDDTAVQFYHSLGSKLVAPYSVMGMPPRVTSFSSTVYPTIDGEKTSKSVEFAMGMKLLNPEELLCMVIIKPIQDGVECHGDGFDMEVGVENVLMDIPYAMTDCELEQSINDIFDF
jgi:hypothetical protein